MKKKRWIWSGAAVLVIGILLFGTVFALEMREKTVSPDMPVHTAKESDSIEEASEVQTSEQEFYDKTDEEPDPGRGNGSDFDTEEIEQDNTMTEQAEVSLVFTGDIYLSPYIQENYDRGGIGEIIGADVWDELTNADILMVNEEFPFGTGGTPAEDKQFTFRVDPRYSQIFTELGVDVVTLANNHVLDYGTEVLMQTFQVLKEKGISYTGAGQNKEEAKALITIEAGGRTFGFLAASRVIPVSEWNIDNRQPGVFTTYDNTALVEEIQKARAKCDFLTVYAHWGIERNTTPEEYQKELAHSYVDAGADLVIGSHPHVLQGVESYKDRMIFYSLGNFMFNQSIESTMIVKVTVSEEQVRYQVIPLMASGAKTIRSEDTKNFEQTLEALSYGVSIRQGEIIKKE